MTSPYLTPDEACDYLRLTAKYRRQTLATLTRQGRIKAAGRIGKVYRYTQESLDRFLRSTL